MTLAASAVPIELRIPLRRLPSHANQLARSFGTQLARRSQLWRTPAAAFWRLMLLTARTGFSGYGNACLHAAIEPDSDQPLPRRRLKAILAGTAAALVGISVILVANQLPRRVASSAGLALWVPLAAEMFPMCRRAWHRRTANTPATDEVVALIRTAGHLGPVAIASLFAADGDGGLLLRKWLRHVDHAGIAVILDAATPSLSVRYCRRGFRSAGGTLRLYRLPAGAK